MDVHEKSNGFHVFKKVIGLCPYKEWTTKNLFSHIILAFFGRMRFYDIVW